MGSEHPVGKAILAAARNDLGLDAEAAIDGSVGEFNAIVGRGISARVEPATSAERARYHVLVGSVRFLRENKVDVPEDAVEASEESAADQADSAEAVETPEESTRPRTET